MLFSREELRLRLMDEYKRDSVRHIRRMESLFCWSPNRYDKTPSSTGGREEILIEKGCASYAKLEVA